MTAPREETGDDRFVAAILSHAVAELSRLVAGLERFCARDAASFGATVRDVALDRDALPHFRRTCRDHLMATPTYNPDLYARSCAVGLDRLRALVDGK